MHINEGEIRAFQDGQLRPDRLQVIQAHLESCAGCQEQIEIAGARKQRVAARLAALDPSPDLHPMTVKTARARLAVRQQVPQEESSMSKKLFSRRYRPAWIVLAVIVLLAVSMAFAPVRAIANSFLGLFRVQQFKVVEVNPAALPNQLGSSSQFESMLSQDVQFTESGPSQSVASPAEASALAGMPVRLPEKIKGTPQLTVQPGGKAVFNVNLQHVQAILAELGRSDVQVPELLEGATVSLEVPTSVVATYGNCGFDAENARQQGYDPDRPETPRLPACTTLVQMPSPTIQAPPGLDLSQIGQAYLQLLGMSPDEAAHFAQNIDWTTTFVIPLPLYSATYRDVPVDGVTGTLIMQNVQDHVAQYMLLWVKDDVVYALIGPGNGSTAVTIASSLK